MLVMLCDGAFEHQLSTLAVKRVDCGHAVAPTPHVTIAGAPREEPSSQCNLPVMFGELESTVLLSVSTQTEQEWSIICARIGQLDRASRGERTRICSASKCDHGSPCERISNRSPAPTTKQASAACKTSWTGFHSRQLPEAR